MPQPFYVSDIFNRINEGDFDIFEFLDTGSYDYIRDRSESFSSEDMMMMKNMPSTSRDGLFCSTSSAVVASNTKQSSSFNKNGTLLYDMSQKSNHIQKQSVKHRSASPGNEMVTLEEFLEESNRLSPKKVSKLCRKYIVVCVGIEDHQREMLNCIFWDPGC